MKVGGLVHGPVNVNLTRPADTNAYAANDVIANSVGAPAVLTIPFMPENGDSGYITKVRALTNVNNFTGRLRLHLYTAAPNAIADNAPFTLLWANRETRIGFIDIPAMQTGGAGSDASNALLADIRLFFKLSDTSKNLFAIVQTLDAFTPVASQQFFFSFLIDRN